MLRRDESRMVKAPHSASASHLLRVWGGPLSDTGQGLNESAGFAELRRCIPPADDWV